MTTGADPEQPATATARLPREVWLLGGVSFFADVSSEMIVPLMPSFVVAVLGASATALGGIEGVAAAIVAVLAAVAGARSDRGARVPYVRAGYGLPVAGKAVIAAATGWPMVLGGRALDRVGKGLRGGPRDALIADVTPAAIRGRAFGLHRTMDTAGAFVGVGVSAVLVAVLGVESTTTDVHAYRVIFAIAAATGIASFVLTLAVREPAARGPVAPRAAGNRAALPRAYWLVLAMLLVFAIANSSDAFLLLRASDAGLSPLSVVLAYAVFNLTYTLASYPAGALSDRVGRWRVIGVGWAIYVVVYAGFATTTDAATVWVLFAVYGLYAALTDGVGKALIADVAPREHRGRAMGIYYFATGAASLASSLVAGVLWDRVSHAGALWLGAIAGAVALVMLVLVHARGVQRETS
jgi:MFS family permease